MSNKINNSTLKDRAWMHRKPTKEEQLEILETGIVGYDTNVLLNFYRYTKETRNALFDATELVKENLFIPDQVCKEYEGNRKGIREKQRKDFEVYKNELEKNLNAVKGTSEKLFARFGATAKSNKKAQKRIDEVVNAVSKEVLHLEKELEASNADLEKNDFIYDELNELLQGSLREGFNAEDYIRNKEAFYYAKEGLAIPGKADAKKSNAGLNDYIIWKEIISECNSKKKAALWISDDVKEDWLLYSEGEHINFLPHLLEEAEYKLFHLSTSEFLELMASQAKNINEESVEEAKNRGWDEEHDSFLTSIQLAKNAIGTIIGSTSFQQNIALQQSVAEQLASQIPKFNLSLPLYQIDAIEKLKKQIPKVPPMEVIEDDEDVKENEIEK